jgi:mannosyl-oligosaccharide alpha-1,2-mannosidase
LAALNKRWSTLLIVAGSFLFFLVLLQSKSPSTTVIPIFGNNYARNLCPATPPNPPYNHTIPEEGFSWRDIPVRYPVQNPIPLSTEPLITLPKI